MSIRLRRMRAQVAELSSGYSDQDLVVPRTRDEIGRLAQTFNGLLAHLRDAIAHERAFTADAGHELRTPLAVLSGELELGRRPGRTRAELLGTVEVAAQQTDRLIGLAENLLVLARDAEAPLVHVEYFDLTVLVRAAADAAAAAAARQGVEIVVLVDTERINVCGDTVRIRQAVDNLLTNALCYSPAGAAITITAAGNARHAELAVADRGPGFPPQFLPIAFDRFTRADNARTRAGAATTGGSGLGLAIVPSVMTVHGGTANAENRAGGGARVTLRWPPMWWARRTDGCGAGHSHPGHTNRNAP